MFSQNQSRPLSNINVSQIRFYAMNTHFKKMRITKQTAVSISEQINHQSYFSWLLKLAQLTVTRKWIQLHSRIENHIISKVSSLELSEREEGGERLETEK